LLTCSTSWTVVAVLDAWDNAFLSCYFDCLDREVVRRGIKDAVSYCNKVCYEEANEALGRVKKRK